tara:strand:+ start:37 stop:975 length:939 start_codon:yes stop_codon:yes gene_type:complete
MIARSNLQPLAPLLSDTYLESIKYGDFRRWRKRLAALPELSPSSVELGNKIRLGTATDCDEGMRAILHDQLREFIPWRKGPFSVFGITIDSEWRSDLKWNRLHEKIGSLQDRIVLDVGCSNGYYGFRMLEAGAKLVIGIEHHIPYVAQFWALKQFVPDLPVFVIPADLRQLPLPLEEFDNVFSMGVIYHSQSPIKHLSQLRQCLRPGGQLVLETLYVDEDNGVESGLMPPETYARMPKIRFIPSIPTILNWLDHCGYANAEIINESITTIEEQRSTDWMPFESLSDALDRDDDNKTIEGLPAPKRVIITAYR